VGARPPAALAAAGQAAITGYLNVYRAVRPDGRSRGLLDAAAIIQARWIGNFTSDTEALFRLSLENSKCSSQPSIKISAAPSNLHLRRVMGDMT
jgi:hypothetical protein